MGSNSSAPRLPAHYLTGMARRYPGCWIEVDRLRSAAGRHLPGWPNWCFLPLAGAYAILSRAGTLTMEQAADVAPFGALAAWRVTQGVYEFDPDLRASIEATPIDGDVPSDILYCLPEWCVYIASPGLQYGDAEVRGFFAFLEHDANDGRSELRLVVDSVAGLQTCMPIHLGRGGLAKGIDSAFAEAERQAILRGASIPPVPARLMAAALTPMINLVLYICARNAEIRDSRGLKDGPTRPEPVRTKAGQRLFPPDRATIWEVGYRLGPALRTALASEEEAEARGGHASPRPHIRRAHWHSYWVGPREDRQISLRWLPPIPVNVDIEHAAIPTIRRVQ